MEIGFLLKGSFGPHNRIVFNCSAGEKKSITDMVKSAGLASSDADVSITYSDLQTWGSMLQRNAVCHVSVNLNGSGVAGDLKDFFDSPQYLAFKTQLQEKMRGFHRGHGNDDFAQLFKNAEEEILNPGAFFDTMRPRV